jgi:hypothetical protein
VAAVGLEPRAESPGKTSAEPPRAAILMQQGAATATDWLADLVASLTPGERARLTELLHGQEADR